MAMSQGTLEIQTKPKSFLDITSLVQNSVANSNIQNNQEMKKRQHVCTYLNENE